MVSFCSMRGVNVFIEQPMASLLFLTPEMSECLKTLSLARIPTHLGGFGGTSVKPIEVYTSMDNDSTKQMRRSKREAFERLGPRRQPIALPKPRTFLKKPSRVNYGWKSAGWVSATVTSGKRQKDSQEYPAEFAASVALVAVSALPQASREASCVAA